MQTLTFFLIVLMVLLIIMDRRFMSSWFLVGKRSNNAWLGRYRLDIGYFAKLLPISLSSFNSRIEGNMNSIFIKCSWNFNVVVRSSQVNILWFLNLLLTIRVTSVETLLWNIATPIIIIICWCSIPYIPILFIDVFNVTLEVFDTHIWWQ
jgi:hypothetical protein